MFESMSDPVDVLTAFTEGTLQPLRFRWHGRVIRVARVSGSWTRREGQALLRYFSVESGTGESYELCFDPRGAKWTLVRAWSGNGGNAA